MSFDKFPLDQQRCMFRVGSYSYDSSKMVFITKKHGYSSKKSNSIALDYEISKFNYETVKALNSFNVVVLNENEQRIGESTKLRFTKVTLVNKEAPQQTVSSPISLILLSAFFP